MGFQAAISSFVLVLSIATAVFLTNMVDTSSVRVSSPSFGPPGRHFSQGISHFIPILGGSNSFKYNAQHSSFLAFPLPPSNNLSAVGVSISVGLLERIIHFNSFVFPCPTWRPATGLLSITSVAVYSLISAASYHIGSTPFFRADN